MPEDELPYSEYPDGALLRMGEGDVTLAKRVVVGACVYPKGGEGEPYPHIAFQFTDDEGNPVHTVVLEGMHPMLPQLVDAANSQIRTMDPRLVAQLMEMMLESAGRDPNLAHERALEMVKERNIVARCPSCSRKIYGEIAARGGCKDCYPELPPGGVPVG